MEPAKVELITKGDDFYSFKHVCWELCLCFNEKINSIATKLSNQAKYNQSTCAKSYFKNCFLAMSMIQSVWKAV